MSSERAGDLNRNWPGRAAVLRSYGGELDPDMVDQIDRAHTASERAGTPTRGTLNREAARAMVAAEFPGSMPSDRLLDALEACVVADPRITDVEPLPDAIVLAVRGGISFTYAGISFEPNR